jgi:hypothetical protein
MRTTRRFMLTVGLLLIVMGGFILNEGVQILTPFAEVLGLVSHVPIEKSLISPTLLTVATSNYTYVSADLKGGVQAKGSLEVGGGREIAFYVMDEGNFTLWRAGRPSAVVLAKPVAISYNFTISPQVAGTYYFIFDNQDTTRCAVVFSLGVVEKIVVLNPVVDYAGYELLGLGIILLVIGVGTGRGKTEPEMVPEIGIRCKFCGAEIASDQTFCGKCGRAQQ